jgi:transposase
MARYKPCDYSQCAMIPVALEAQLVPGTLEYAIHHVVEERLDLRRFSERYRNDDTGRIAYDPKVLLKIVLLGYSRGLLSSRTIERACAENVTFMALACGQKPDHSTIADFVSSMPAEVEEVFTQVLLVCEEDGLLGGTHFSLDGVKLPGNAAKEWSGTFPELRKKKEKLEAKVREAMQEHCRADQEPDPTKPGSDPKRRQERIQRLREKAERIEQFLAQNQPRAGSRGKEVQSNVTDNESAKMVTSHGVVQGYNANALVDDKRQVIMHGEAFGAGDDREHMEPMLAGTKRNLEAIGHTDPLKGRQGSADTGYHSMKNLEACRDYEVDAYIPDRDFRKRDPRFADAARHRRPVSNRPTSTKRWFTPRDFHLDEQTGKLICPAGQRLYVRNRNFAVNGRRAIAYQAPISACRDCKLRAKCMRHAHTPSRQVYIFYGHLPNELTDAMKQKIDTVEGRAIYSKRLGTVEPVFANIRAQKKLNRFTLRGRTKVNIQWRLYCIVHNIEKILHYGRSFATAG